MMMLMNKIDGLEESFKSAKVVFLTTYFQGKEKSRPMINLNDSPYNVLWFPTEKGTEKVKHIKNDSRVILTFPASNKGEFFEIEGNARIEDDKDKISEKWVWWYLYWRPSQREKYWFPQGEASEKSVIIYLTPNKSRLVKKA